MYGALRQYVICVESRLVFCFVLSFGRIPTFRMNVLHPSSGLEWRALEVDTLYFLPYSQQSTTAPIPDPDESNPQLSSRFLKE